MFVRHAEPQKDLTGESGNRNVCVGRMCHEDEGSMVEEYPLIKNAPCSTLVSLHIYNILLRIFHSPINKASPFHPDGERKMKKIAPKHKMMKGER